MIIIIWIIVLLFMALVAFVHIVGAGCFIAGILAIAGLIGLAIAFFSVIFIALQALLGEENSGLAFLATLPVGIAIICLYLLFNPDTIKSIKSEGLHRFLQSRRRTGLLAVCCLALAGAICSPAWPTMRTKHSNAASPDEIESKREQQRLARYELA
jgi:hypothetical protein